MNILGEIVKHKRNELISQKLNSTIKELEQSESFKIKCRSLKSSILTSKSGIICEFKRRSPSKDIIESDTFPLSRILVVIFIGDSRYSKKFLSTS